jgi:uncharacterized protein with gpF-like domain
MAAPIGHNRPPPDVTVDRVVAAYLKVKAQRAAFTAEANLIDAMYEEKLDTLQRHLLKYLNETKQDAIQTLGVSVYKHKEIKPAASDWNAIYKWIVKNQAWDLLEKRLKQTFVAQYKEANKGELPPGVSVMETFVAKVRRLPRKKGQLPDGDE